MKAKIIPAKKPELRAADTSGGIAGEAGGPLKVAAYCRVSSEHEEQESSYEIQCTHYTNMIENHPGWELAGIYADEGISGVSVKHREEFLRMIEDCEEGRIQMVITKSISRFARNTLDSLTYIRKLKSLGIPVVFEKEGINTMDARGELLLTVLSSIAQQESESISKNVQLGIRFHYQEGKVCAGHQNILGYRRTDEGSLEIVPEEADIVRHIFRLYLDGFTPSHIGKILRNEHVIDRRGVERSWGNTAVIYILTNEKYMGDLRLQKYYTADFLEKKCEPNRGQVPQYYVENSHPPIIPKEIFARVQDEMNRRRKSGYRYCHDTSLAGRVICGICGSPYIRKVEGKTKRPMYRCGTRITKHYKDLAGECGGKGVEEPVLQAAVLEAFKRLPEERDEILKLRERVTWGPMAKADWMLEDLQNRMDENTDEEQGIIDEELQSNLMEQMAEIAMKRAEFAEKEVCLRNLANRVDKMVGKDDILIVPDDPACSDAEDFFERTRYHYSREELRTFSDREVISMVEKVVICESTIWVIFKGGISIEVEKPEWDKKAQKVC